ncbi:hypothetical protein [Desulfoferrobacter suflitae]|uniref:hypothetical protein n=1 Tax=Desulfoferrobacter suflitae TaxID=2865782 RepID=UPI0021643B17|nr:hypothetical protein [Desulfoferrobacter suflitae]MCK8604478.1 hypothetical protein [Desulfoferrobacter suflitae]
MIQTGHLDDLFGVFDLPCQQFESLISALCDESTAAMEHGRIEDLICRMGNELLRRLIQAHLDLRALREPRRKQLTAPDGTHLADCRENCERTLATIFGDVKVRRKGYGAPGIESKFPLDAELNLAPDKYSHGLRYRAVEQIARHSFDEAVADVKKTTGGKIPKRQMQEIAVAAARDFETFYSGRKTEGAEQTSDILVMSTDGKGIVMRKEDLRAATRKAAEQAKQETGARLQPWNRGRRLDF